MVHFKIALSKLPLCSESNQRKMTTMLLIHLELDFRFTLSVAQSWGDGTEAVATATVRLGDVAAVAVVCRRRDHTAGTAAAAATLVEVAARMAALWRSDTALYKKADKQYQKGRVIMTHTGPFLLHFVDWSLS